jgi:nicotinate-nucleotide adenylyltransferase
LVLGEAALDQLKLTKVLWVPAGQPWRKAGLGVSRASDRVEMTRRAIAGNDRFQLSTVEVEKDGPSYTVETLADLRKWHAGDLFLIMGGDALLDLPSWQDHEGVVGLAHLAVACRGDREGLLAQAEAALPGVSERVEWIDMPRIDVSSTLIRERCAAGASVRYLTPDHVADYITERALYR